MQSRDGNTQVSKQYLTYPLNSPIEYTGDFTGTYSKYSIVDKNYVDSLVQTTIVKRLISGGAEWTEVGMTFSISELQYTFTGPILTTPASALMLSDGDPFNSRIDAIVVYDTGDIGKIDGTPSGTPQTPAIPDNAILIQYIPVSAGSTVPNISYENVYLEDTEWQSSLNVVTSGTWSGLVGTVSFQSNSEVYQGSVSTYVTSDSRTYISYQKAIGTVSYSQFVLLTLKVKLPTAISNSKNITVTSYYNSTSYGDSVILSNYGFSRSSTSWQSISIPTSAFGTVPTMNRLVFRMTGVDNGDQNEWYLDKVQLQTGISPPVTLPKISIYDDGVDIGSRPKINFIEGSNVIMSISDNNTEDRIDLTISAAVLIGATGATGSSGTSGTSGSSGTSGTEGTSGSSGTSGTEGTSGSSGTSGTSGTSGAVGATGPAGSGGGAAGISGQFQINNGSGTFSQFGISIGTNLVIATSSSFVSGTNNTFFGFNSGVNNSGSCNTFIGSSSGFTNTTGAEQVFIGFQSGYFNTTGNYNVFIGSCAGYSNNSGYSNTFIGYKSGRINTQGYINTFVGDSSGFSNTSGACNVFIGQSSGYSNTTGTNNTFLGIFSGFTNTEGTNNAFIGDSSGFSNTNGNFNLFLGSQAGYSNISGGANTFIGNRSGYFNQGGDYNLFLGFRSGYNNIASGNTFLGAFAGCCNTTGTDNVYIGFNAGINGTQSTGNLYLGKQSGADTTGNYNTFIGFNTNSSTSVCNSIAIGAGATTSVNGDFAIGSVTYPINTTSSATSISTYMCVVVNGTAYRIPLYT